MVTQVGLSTHFRGIHFAEGLAAYEGIRSYATYPDLQWKRVASVPAAENILQSSGMTRYFLWTSSDPTGITPSTAAPGSR